ncbi:CDF family Co(II)/Ni(II) efflux transporter DmeF [Rhizobium sp. CRIBSB]|nr:CDF family Co(II)/Ni(II) efflux transporter DmeF [Rhizobium sp. CRIBSB]
MTSHEDHDHPHQHTDHHHQHADHHGHSHEATDPRPAQRLGNRHSHVFLGADHDRNARRTWIVIAITATMMVAEITAGLVYGSMALLADGWHMATHAGAILIAALAYGYAKRHAENGRFTFGTGKVGDLAAFASAIVLAIAALLIGWESFWRLTAPVEIEFSEAIAVAAIGLVVNLVCAVLLHGGGEGHHAHHHDHHHHDAGHDHHHAGGDSNLRAAYVHVLADALTSVLAIVALVFGSLYGWLWLDPVIGLVGMLVIGRWSLDLMQRSGAVLLDYVPRGESLPAEIRAILEREGAEIADLHVWQLGPGHHGAIVSLSAEAPHAPSHYRDKLARLSALSHVTIEVDWPEMAHAR